MGGLGGALDLRVCTRNIFSITYIPFPCPPPHLGTLDVMWNLCNWKVTILRLFMTTAAVNIKASTSSNLECS